MPYPEPHPETRREMIATYEVILANTDNDESRESVRELLEMFRQESLRMMQ